MTLDDLTRDLFRMPNEPPSGVTETCPDCMARGQQPSAWHRPDAQTLTCAYTCTCLLYTSPSPRDLSTSRMPSSA